MRLSNVLQLPGLKNRGMVLIRTRKARDSEYVVIAHHTEWVFPILKLYALISMGTENRDPGVSKSEIDTVLF